MANLWRRGIAPRAQFDNRQAEQPCVIIAGILLENDRCIFWATTNETMGSMETQVGTCRWDRSTTFTYKRRRWWWTIRWCWCDQSTGSFIAAFGFADGKERWRQRLEALSDILTLEHYGGRERQVVNRVPGLVPDGCLFTDKAKAWKTHGLRRR